MNNIKQADAEYVAKSICKKSNYELEKHIGEGGFKQVYLVKDSNGSCLALKILIASGITVRNNREISCLAKFNHPNIARLIAVGMENYNGKDYLYMLEEYLSGGSLSQLIETKKQFLNDDIFKIGKILIEVIDYLESYSIVHRDIKPDNIIFREDGITPVLVDFGIVRLSNETSVTQTWLDRGPGTPYYASPEQLNNEKNLIDWRTDQFSLGVTLSIAKFKYHPYQYPDEEYLDYRTVERVANRGKRHQHFFELINEFSPKCFSRMTSSWPVERFCNTSELTKAWGT